jgi:lysophospholipase L1-like esterase
MKKLTYLLVLCIIIFSGCKKAPADAVTVINSGVSGNTAASLLARITDATTPKPTLVLVMIGTNEAILGDTSYVHFQRNLTEVVNALKASGTSVLLLTPPPIVSKFNSAINSARLDTVRAEIEAVSQSAGCGYFDIYSNIETILHAYIVPGIYNPDGVHPNKAGYADMTDYLYQYLKNGITKGTKIVCFGDSITYGLGVNGAGTTTGDTYPADLYRELNTYFYANN